MLAGVRGIGTWTAQMFLMFQLRRLDVWPTGDLGVRKGFGLAWGMPTPTPKQLEALGEPYRPSFGRGVVLLARRRALRRRGGKRAHPLARAAGMPGPRSLFCLGTALLAGRNCFRGGMGGAVSARFATGPGFLLRAGERSRGCAAASWTWPDNRGDLRFRFSARWTRTQLPWPGLCAVHGATGCRCHRYPIKERACEF